ncbi:MAG: TRAP transporter substrate-binding protein [Desulfococcaceae bacterium]
MTARRMGISVALATFALALSLPLSTVAAKTLRLTYANFPPAPTFPCVQMEHWSDEIEKRTDGAVQVDTFPGGTLLGAKSMMDGVITGQADIGCVALAYQPGRYPVANATSLPLDIPNARVGSKVLWDLFVQYKPESLKPVKVLTMFTSPPSNIMSRKPIRKLEDMAGMDLRASGGAAEILKAWGANQIGMPMSATPEALQKGVVEGLLSSLDVMKDLKFAELCRYVTVTDTVIYPFAVVMNLDRWNSLPPEVRQAMEGMAEEHAEWTGNYVDNHVKNALEWSKETYDVEVIRLSEEERTRWNERLAPIADNWISDAAGKGLPAEKIVSDIRALAGKYGE